MPVLPSHQDPYDSVRDHMGYAALQGHVAAGWDTTICIQYGRPVGAFVLYTVLHLSSKSSRTGYGHHGDYMFGWEGDTLQRAMDKCTEFNGDPTYCKEFQVQTDKELNSCTLPNVVDERIDGCK